MAIMAVLLPLGLCVLPVVYMARDLIIFIRENPFQGLSVVVGPENLDFLGPKNQDFQVPSLSMARVMDFP
jgi:hypothetical protein